MSRVGEKIVYCRYAHVDTTFEDAVVGIYTIERETPTQLVCKRTKGEGTKEKRFSKAICATAEELAAADRVLDERAKDAALSRQERAAREADPRHKMIYRLTNGDFEPWEKLTLEQLTTICGWLDAARATEQLP